MRIFQCKSNWVVICLVVFCKKGEASNRRLLAAVASPATTLALLPRRARAGVCPSAKFRKRELVPALIARVRPSVRPYASAARRPSVGVQKAKTITGLGDIGEGAQKGERTMRDSRGLCRRSLPGPRRQPFCGRFSSSLRPEGEKIKRKARRRKWDRASQMQRRTHASLTLQISNFKLAQKSIASGQTDAGFM